MGCGGRGRGSRGARVGVRGRGVGGGMSGSWGWVAGVGVGRGARPGCRAGRVGFAGSGCGGRSAGPWVWGRHVAPMGPGMSGSGGTRAWSGARGLDGAEGARRQRRRRAGRAEAQRTTSATLARVVTARKQQVCRGRQANKRTRPCATRRRKARRAVAHAWPKRGAAPAPGAHRAGRGGPPTAEGSLGTLGGPHLTDCIGIVIISVKSRV